ncbi:MAG TPA: tetratricopeptide repeat protein, partial [Bacteroidia bacterium]|nr:tetratricopeptide repeat protein [Bacteroidia bacterium]
MKKLSFLILICFSVVLVSCDSFNRGIAAAGYNSSGLKKYNAGDYKGAIADYDKAIQMHAAFAEAYNNRGLAEYYLGEYQASMTDYNKAIELKPDLSVAYSNRGQNYDAVGKYTEAIADYST